MGCGGSGDGVSDEWGNNSGSVVRVSNIKGRVIPPLDVTVSAREQSSIPRFSLTSALGTRVFVEDDPGYYAIADANGDFLIHNVPAGRHRLVASVVAGVTTYRQRSDVITVTGEYETQVIMNSIPLEPALYNAKLHISDLYNDSPLFSNINIWGYNFQAINGIVDIGPFPGGNVSKEASITSIGYRDAKALISFGENKKSEIFIKLTPTSSTDPNQAPVVEIEQSSLIVRTNEAINLIALGMDPEGDAISWKWAADKGEFYNDFTQQTTYTAPSTPGTVRISLTGTDSHGASGQAILDLEIIQGGSKKKDPQNKPPVQPNTPFPENLAQDMAGELTLTWNCSDPDNDSLTYSVNFGRQGETLTLIANELATPALLVKDLLPNTRYFWTVTAYDEHYASTESPMWQFTTGNLNKQPPNVPTYPHPANLASDIENSVTLSWSGGHPEGVPVTYRVYIATVSTFIESEPTPLTLMHTTNLLRYDFINLAKGATYQWQIIAKDAFGSETPGPVWQFSTLEPENNMPSYASITEPADKATMIPISQNLRWTAEDADGDTLYYDVYFGTEMEPPLVSASQTGRIYKPGTLTASTTYYWHIVVSDGKSTNPRSDLWSFTTAPVVEESPRVESITAPKTILEPLVVKFNKYVDRTKESDAFVFVPNVEGTWTWKEDNTIAEFMPAMDSWYPGSYNVFTVVGKNLTDVNGESIQGNTVMKFTLGSTVPVPDGYKSYAFPMLVAANTTVNVPIPNLPSGKMANLVVISHLDSTSISVGSALAEKSTLSEYCNSKDPTYRLRLEEAEMVNMPIPTVEKGKGTRASVNAAAVGDARDFYIDPIATTTSRINAIIHTRAVAVSGSSIVYLDDAVSSESNINKAKEIQSIFDTRILDKMREAYATEPPIGIDGETRVSIVLTPLGLDTAGYYTWADLYKRDSSSSITGIRYSNEGKIIYIKTGLADTTTFGTLAHEFQHMINFYQKNKSLDPSASKTTEDTWLNEALAKYAEEVCGFGMVDGDVNTSRLVIQSMKNNNNLGVTSWDSENANSYGISYLFMHFLARPGRYKSTSEEVTKPLVTGGGRGLIGKDNIEAMTNEPFEETLAKFALSLFINDYQSSDPKAYGLDRINLVGKSNNETLPGFKIEEVSSGISVKNMKADAFRFFKKTSKGDTDTTFTITTGTKPVTLWFFDERP